MASTQAGRAARQVRVTDQALVAVRAARTAAGAREAHVADLLAGLAAEPDGAAGRLLRQHMTAATRLTERAAAAPPGLPALETAVARADHLAAPRPPGTPDLLAAAIEVGGTDLVDLLTACGYDVRATYRAAVDAVGEADETLGLPASDTGGDLSPAAALAVARTRALAGGAVDLVLQLAAGDAGALLPCDRAELRVIVDLMGQQGDLDRESWDAGVDTVVDAARTWRAGEPVRASDLLRAAVVAGGEGPQRLLTEAERLAGDDRDRPA